MKQTVWALSSGILLGLGWLVDPIFVFVGFVPLLFLLPEPKFWRFAGYIYLAFFMWNVIAAWWSFAAEPVASVVLFTVAPALMTLPMLCLRRLQKFYTPAHLSWLLPACWISYEFLQYQWALSWSWLTLGNSLAGKVLLGGYTYMGVLGSSLYVLWGNLLVYATIQHWRKMWIRKAVYALAGIVGLVLVYVLFGIFLIALLDIKNIVWKSPHVIPNTIVVQPNIDPKTQKLPNTSKAMPPLTQALHIIRLLKPKIDTNIRLVVLPEAILGQRFEQSGLEHQGNYPAWDTLRAFFDQYPKTAFLLGLNTHRWVVGKECNDTYAHFDPITKRYIKLYNSALLYQKGEPKQYHHKTRRVPVGEYLPFPKSLASIIPQISETITPDTSLQLLKTKDGLRIGALICYESCFGTCAGEMARKGADFFCIITDDAYWRDTPQPKQHLGIDRLRATEHQRAIIRASNHGFSGMIDASGKVRHLTPTNQAQASAFYFDYPPKTGTLVQTFYTRWGDWLGVCALVGLFAACLPYLRAMRKQS